VPIIILGLALFAVVLVSWVTTPLEPEH